ncbi:hypothetical protein [Belnapia rosea]|uniref:ATP-dependent Clp protease ATP-binding subunit ClpB n=1 Tax=Belnapia rosea TaxID=938405 RepID=A0A1G7E0K2_9PROT|nr:hypothetical protein [Belnapia rosea]SDE57020.1 ATP-dependent Clp protease ATP-binding subunit ClpB [Belnapia rosea]
MTGTPSMKVSSPRPLDLVEPHLQDQLANLLLEGRIHDGETVQVTAGLDGLKVRRAASLGLAEAA